MAEQPQSYLDQFKYFQKSLSLVSPNPIQMVVMPFNDYFPNLYENPNDLYEKMKPLILFARFTFIIPWGRSNTSWKETGLRLTILPAISTTLLMCWMCNSIYYGIKGVLRRGASGSMGVFAYVLNIHSTSGLIMDLYVYFYLLKNSKRFYKIFERWDYINTQIHLEKDKWLRPLSYLLIIYPIGQVVFFGYLHYLGAIGFRRRKDMSWLQVVNDIFMRHYKLPYNPVYPILWIFVKCLNRLTFHFITPLIIFLSRALSFQFKMLIVEAAGCNTEDAHLADVQKKDKFFWINLMKKHRALTQLTKTVNVFLSPLMFWWTTYYIYSTSIQLYRALFGIGIRQIQIPQHIFWTNFSFDTFHFFLTLIFATKVNTYAVKIINILRNCPREHYYDTEIYRLEHVVLSGPTIGFTGMGTFQVTREFLISVFNAVFTIEIILLQSAESA